MTATDASRASRPRAHPSGCPSPKPKSHGSGFVGLIRFRGRPVGISRLPDPQEQVLKEVLADFADKGNAGRVAAAYARVAAVCKERKIAPVSDPVWRLWHPYRA